jgi:hypothetical protein
LISRLGYHPLLATFLQVIFLPVLKMWAPKVVAGFLAVTISIFPALSAPLTESGIEGRAVTYTPVSFKTIYVPPSTYNTPRTLYGRTVQLADGTLLATWYAKAPPK